jgi:hypothetical protein
MKRHHLLPLVLLPLLLTGCGTEHISEHIFTQALGITGDAELTLYAKTFSGDKAFAASGRTAADAIRSGEAAQGGRIFIGHTELLCLDGSRTEEVVQDLLLERGLSPACKLLYTQVEQTFRHADPASVLKSIRMAEENGLVPLTDISTVLEEWLGSRQTALLPALSDTGLKMVLLRTDGECTVLSPEAAQGMYWLRRHGNTDFSMTVRMGQNMEDVQILRSTLRKTLSDGKRCYKVGVITDNCPETVKPALRMLISRQCRAAVSEMRSARADVIGMETLAAYGGIAFTDAVEIGVEVY